MLPSKGDLNDKRTIVRTEVVLDDGKTLPVDYAFRKTANGDWKAYDVIIEGISYITNYRNQVGAEIAEVGPRRADQRLETQGEKTLENMDQEQTRNNDEPHAVLQRRIRHPGHAARVRGDFVFECGRGARTHAAARTRRRHDGYRSERAGEIR